MAAQVEQVEVSCLFSLKLGNPVLDKSMPAEQDRDETTRDEQAEGEARRGETRRGEAAGRGESEEEEEEEEEEKVEKEIEWQDKHDKLQQH